MEKEIVLSMKELPRAGWMDRVKEKDTARPVPDSTEGDGWSGRSPDVGFDMTDFVYIYNSYI